MWRHLEVRLVSSCTVSSTKSGRRVHPNVLAMDTCNPAFDHHDCDILMNIKKEYIHTEDQDIVDYPPISIMVKQESDNSTQDDSCNNIDKLTGLTYDIKPVLLCGDSSNMDKRDSWIGDGIIPDADVKQHDTKIGEGIKSKSSNCYAIKSDHVDHSYATTSDRYTIHAVKSELTDTCTEQEPIHYVEKHVSTLHGER